MHLILHHLNRGSVFFNFLCNCVTSQPETIVPQRVSHGYTATAKCVTVCNRVTVWRRAVKIVQKQVDDVMKM